MRQSGPTSSDRSIMDNPFGVDRAPGPAPRDQTIDMGDGFTRGHADQVWSDFARKQRPKEINRPARGFAQSPLEAIKGALMAVNERIEALVQAAKWLVVGRQHQHIVRQCSTKFLAR